MKKYNTRPIDFTGCHPVIAEALKQGENIECWVWDSGRDRGCKTEAWICRYLRNSGHPYRSSSDTPWKNAEPIPIKTHRIMPPERAIQVLIAAGWRYDENGVLLGDPPIIPQMFKEMGGPIDNSLAVWPPCIIEEVEDDE